MFFEIARLIFIFYDTLTLYRARYNYDYLRVNAFQLLKKWREKHSNTRKSAFPDKWIGAKKVGSDPVLPPPFFRLWSEGTTKARRRHDEGLKV